MVKLQVVCKHLSLYHRPLVNFKVDAAMMASH